MEPAEVHWRTSSFSGASQDGNGCVEVAFLSDGDVWVRDTKDRLLPPHRYTVREWEAFLAGARAGEFDHA